MDKLEGLDAASVVFELKPGRPAEHPRAASRSPIASGQGCGCCAAKRFRPLWDQAFDGGMSQKLAANKVLHFHGKLWLAPRYVIQS